MTVRYSNAVLEITTANQTLYTVPVDVSTATVRFGVCNNIGADTTLTMWVVPSGEAVGDDNKFMTAQTVPSSTPNYLPALVGSVLETGDSVVMVAGSNDRLNVKLSLIEVVDS